jgi:hypothetical protein
MNLSHLPLRAAIGAFFVNSGLSKRSLDGDAAAGVHGMAAKAMPVVNRIEPAKFGRLLSGSEILSQAPAGRIPTSFMRQAPPCCCRSSRRSWPARPWSGSAAA